MNTEKTSTPWTVFQTVLLSVLPEQEREALIVLFTEFFTKKMIITLVRIAFDEEDKTILRYAVKTTAIHDNDQLRMMTDFLKSKVGVKETIIAGTLVPDPDVSKPIPKAT